MTEQARSYRKTVVVAAATSALALAAGVTAIWAAFGPLRGQPVPLWLGWALALAAALGLGTFAILVAAGGLIALRRDALEEAGVPYASAARRESLVGPFRGWLFRTLRRNDRADGTPRHRLGLRPGEWVEIRSLEEILSTLDDEGTLDGVPFMPEMAAYCGRRARVFRRVDKLNDWMHAAGLTRARNLVQLEGIRCDGSWHGGCETCCHIRWREAWLRRSGPGAPSGPPSRPSPAGIEGLARSCTREDESGETRFVCQATQLTAGAPPLSSGDPRHYLRDLWYGNVRLLPFVIGVAIGCFNWVQVKRRGSDFPLYVPAGATGQTPEKLQLQPGERVRVKPKHAIEATLNAKSQNRGLYFDRDMLRYSGGVFTVRARLQRVVAEKTGKLIELPTPCITLEGVTATGEYAGFNPENEYIFWREVWLERAHGASPTEDR